LPITFILSSPPLPRRSTYRMTFSRLSLPSTAFLFFLGFARSFYLFSSFPPLSQFTLVCATFSPPPYEDPFFFGGTDPFFFSLFPPGQGAFSFHHGRTSLPSSPLFPERRMHLSPEWTEPHAALPLSRASPFPLPFFMRVLGLFFFCCTMRPSPFFPPCWKGGLVFFFYLPSSTPATLFLSGWRLDFSVPLLSFSLAYTPFSAFFSTRKVDQRP